MELVEEVATALQTLGVGTLSVDLFHGRMPNEPVNVVLVIGEVGTATIGDPIDRPSFMVIVRGNSTKDVLEKSSTIRALLHNSWNILPVRKGRISALGYTSSIYYDEAKNMLTSLSFTSSLAP